MVEICKYRLPCGRCDKFDTHCDLTPDSVEDKLKEEECEHDWLLASTETKKYQQYNYVVCSKCGEKRVYMTELTYDGGYETKIYITKLERFPQIQ